MQSVKSRIWTRVAVFISYDDNNYTREPIHSHFIDMYSGSPECFPVPNKKAETVSHLLMEEIFPRFGAPLQMVTDNGPENVNNVLKWTLLELNIYHVTTSFYYPQSNGKVERLHRTMNDILAKKIRDNPYSWDLYINQILTAIRFHPSESTKFSPFYLLYNCKVILPLDNLLRPRRKYQGDDYHEIALQEQHRAFTSVRENLKKVRKRQMRRLESKSKFVEFKVGHFVYYKNHQRQSKLDKRWLPFYVVLEKTCPVPYRIKNQLTNTVTKAKAEHPCSADVHKWDIPSPERRIHKTILAAPVGSNSSDTETAEEDGTIYQPLRSGRIWHKVNFLSGV